MPIRRPGKTRCAGAGLAPGHLRCRFAPPVCESVALPRSPASRRILDQMFGLIANTVKRKNQPTTKEKDKEAPPIRHVNRPHRTGWGSCGIDHGSSLAFPTQLTKRFSTNKMIGIAWRAWPNLPLFGDASEGLGQTSLCSAMRPILTSLTLHFNTPRDMLRAISSSHHPRGPLMGTW